MSRLVAFGCSFTFGDSLEDTLDNTRPSKLAWPNLVANKMNLDCDNQAVCGLSNLGIVDKIINYKFDETDIVLVMWTFFERDLLWQDDGTSYNLTWNLSNSELVDSWATTHTVRDRRIRAWYNMHHVYHYLKALGLRFYFLHTSQEKGFLSIKPTWAENINFLPTKFTDFMNRFPKALDNSHPGSKSHEFLASFVFQYINSTEFPNQS